MSVCRANEDRGRLQIGAVGDAGPDALRGDRVHSYQVRGDQRPRVAVTLQDQGLDEQVVVHGARDRIAGRALAPTDQVQANPRRDDALGRAGQQR